MKIQKIILWWIIAYAVVTMVGIGHTVFNWLVLDMVEFDASAGGMYGITSYAETVPWHPLYNILLWPLFAIPCLRQVPRDKLTSQALRLGAIWLGLSVLIDLIGWVLIPHPWQCTFAEFYLLYQPWITLIYLAIFVSPLITALLIRRIYPAKKGNTTPSLEQARTV